MVLFLAKWTGLFSKLQVYVSALKNLHQLIPHGNYFMQQGRYSYKEYSLNEE